MNKFKSCFIIIAVILGFNSTVRADSDFNLSEIISVSPSFALGVGGFNSYESTFYSEIKPSIVAKGFLLNIGTKKDGINVLGVGLGLVGGELNPVIFPVNYVFGGFGVGPDFFIRKDNSYFGISISYVLF